MLRIPLLRARAALAILILTFSSIFSACSNNSDDFFPLNAGRAWHYDVSRITMDGTFRQKHILETLPAIEWQDQIGVPKISAGGEQYLYQRTEVGVQRVAVKAPTAPAFIMHDEPFTILPADQRLGSSWHHVVFTRVLENTGPPWETLFRIVEPVPVEFRISATDARVEVPAGTFEDCLKVTGSGQANVDVGNYIGRAVINVEIENWYAQGIGLVKSIRRETTDAEALNLGEIQVELEYASH